MYNRVCFVDVEKGSDQVVQAGSSGNIKEVSDGGVKFIRYNGLDVKFNIQLSASGWVKEGTVSICGLDDETIQYYMDVIGWQEPMRRRWIRVYAGYEDTGYDCIFAGKVCSCHPTLQPDVWLNMEVMSPDLCDKTKFSISLTKDNGNVSMKDVAAQIANSTNLSFLPSNFMIEDKGIKKSYSFGPGSFVQHKSHFEGEFGTFNAALLVRNGSLWVIDKNAKNNDPWRGKVAPQVIREDQIVGIPQFDWPNMTVSILLYPGVYPFQQVTLKMAERFQKWWKDKTYYVNTITHSGHFRGGNWLTTMQLCDKTKYLNNGQTIEAKVKQADEKADLKMTTEVKAK